MAVDEVEEGSTESSSGAEVAEKRKLTLEVKVTTKSACERHLTATVSREDVDYYFGNAFTDLMPKAAVPGFRTGRAPRKLVEARFRKDLADQVKGSLIMDSLEQIFEDQKLAPISEPDLNPTSVEIPDEGPLTFEFNIEVRPEFDLPNWKGLAIERPVREFSDADVDQQLRALLEREGELVPFDGPAGSGDFITTNITFSHEGKEISTATEQTLRLRKVLSFRDGKIEKFDAQMQGVKGGDKRTLQAKLTEDAPNEALRGKTVNADFTILEIKKLEVPQVNKAFLEQYAGSAETEEELRLMLRAALERRLQYAQQQSARKQVLSALTVAANWDLPPDLLRRQSKRELERSVLELRRSGFSDEEILAHENTLRQNSRASTARALKEHFILERIAEEEKIEATPDDYNDEIKLIASQSGEPARRVRAKLEKQDMMDALRNQIVERKSIELILSHAQFKEVPFQLESADAEAVDRTAGGGDEAENDIPEAQFLELGEPGNKGIKNTER